MVSTLRIRDLFNGRFFEIPKYQRGYAWEVTHVRELFDDIFEAIESNSNHYLGTVVLSKKQDERDCYYIVDGQQRITTLLLIINSILNRLPAKDRDYYYRFYIFEQNKYRLNPLGKDRDFFISLLERSPKSPTTRSQRLLQKAYDEIESILNNIENISLNGLLNTIEQLEIMQFIEESEGDAIRIFQTVNDRGKPLSNMEKAKSLLIYFSNRYLGKKYDKQINDRFGEIFELFDEIKQLADEIDITLIKNIEFIEDNIMRYHFVAFSNENYDASAEYVLKFLKRKLNEFRKTNKIKELEQFIINYTKSLNQFFKSLNQILWKAKTNPIYYETFAILGLSATLYPITIILEAKHLLDKKMTNQKWNNYTFFEMIRNIDIRVYKTRGTDPRADILRYTYEISNNSSITAQDITDWLIWFNKRWMPAQEFSAKLNTEIYGNASLPYWFIKYCESLDGKNYDILKLKSLKEKIPTIEHILSQHPNFSVTAYGFHDEDDYVQHEHRLGNLTILEKNLNSSVRDKTPTEKTPIYDRSVFKMSNEVSSQISRIGSFNKTDIDNRTNVLANFIKEICPC